MKKELTCSMLFEQGHSAADKLIFSFEYPWEILPHIGDFITEYGKTLPKEKYDSPTENVWIAKSAKVSPLATISGPCVIGENTEVRQCAFIRGKALVGDGCVIGNSTELKNCIIFDGCQVPHFNYVGDSILGFKSHMGAGSITSNVKSDKTLVSIKCGEERIETGLKKMGAALGDYVEVGCNSVLNPGTVIGAHSNVYPLSSVRGAVPKNSIFKAQDNIVTKNN
ncbi:MAG: UDP-N-acetylglucosamine pyrophosphorylase [Ruminococcaceae bacterium]|nr:UDP-N-acetylglucosamine pyrophosphorylase [Oscillospiraceae bacterium]